jgi:hypothetical protein
MADAKRSMALHRDIYWVGKQWAVTGYGIQACNQKQRSQFDIAGSRLWDAGVQDAIRAEKWVNADDFEKAVAVARRYFPEPPREASPPEERLLPSGGVSASDQIVQKPAVATFELRIERAPARWIRVWRIRRHDEVRS